MSRPEPVHEKIIKELGQAVQEVLDRYGEPSGAVVCVSWTSGNESLPVGSVVLPKESEGRLEASVAVSSLDQLRKMSDRLYRWLVKAGADAAKNLNQTSQTP